MTADAAIRREFVKNLAEVLVQFDGLHELGNELERKGMFNNLHRDMSEEQAEEELQRLVENYNLLRPEPPQSWQSLMKDSDPHSRGEWAHGEILSNISNEDS